MLVEAADAAPGIIIDMSNINPKNKINLLNLIWLDLYGFINYSTPILMIFFYNKFSLSLLLNINLLKLNFDRII